MSRSTVDEDEMVEDLEIRLKKRYGEDVWSKMQKETPEMTSTYKLLRFIRGHGKKKAFEAYEAMRACPFSNPQVQAIAKRHSVGVSQVCLRWVLQKGAVFAVGLGTNVSMMADYSKEDLDLYSFELSATEMTTLSSQGKQLASCAQGY